MSGLVRRPASAGNVTLRSLQQKALTLIVYVCVWPIHACEWTDVCVSVRLCVSELNLCIIYFVT
jgi:hypothetical protein